MNSTQKDKDLIKFDQNDYQKFSNETEKTKQEESPLYLLIPLLMFLFVFAITSIYCFTEYNRRHLSTYVNLRSSLDDSYFNNTYDFDPISPMFADSLMNPHNNNQSTQALKQTSNDNSTIQSTQEYSGPSDADLYKYSADWPVVPQSLQETDPNSALNGEDSSEFELKSGIDLSEFENIESAEYDYKFDADINKFVKVLKSTQDKSDLSTNDDTELDIKYADMIKEKYGMDENLINLQASQDDELEDLMYEYLKKISDEKENKFNLRESYMNQENNGSYIEQILKNTNEKDLNNYDLASNNKEFKELFNKKYLESYEDMSADEEYEHLKLLEAMQFDNNNKNYDSTNKNYVNLTSSKIYDDEEFDPRHIVQPKHLIKKDKLLKNSYNDIQDDSFYYNWEPINNNNYEYNKEPRLRTTGYQNRSYENYKLSQEKIEQNNSEYAAYMQKIYGVDISPYLKSNNDSRSNSTPYLTHIKDERVVPKPRVIQKRYSTPSEEDDARSGRLYAKELYEKYGIVLE
eukprot:Mrub_02870.p1 GENE.Mrub_02870~~Mrub_02870.p1  ORF type:complete len:518 (+),score=116.00 Mrub_02870:3-1556(+)